MSKKSADEWLSIGRERAADAESVLTTRPASVGAVYLAGYGVECSIKAYLEATKRKVVVSGAAGHNLTNLWKASGLRKSDLGGTDGSRSFFLEDWSTSLRYSITEDFHGQTHEQLVQGAKQITGWLHQQVQRRSKLRRKR
jgi:hypothetical protein